MVPLANTRTGHSDHAVVHGIGVTARTMAAGAAIMVAVFAGFVAGNDPVIKTLGLGLATAVLVDATLVRLVLVPATMKLLGRLNWWLPAWLDRLLPELDGHQTYGPDRTPDALQPTLEPALGASPSADAARSPEEEPGTALALPRPLRGARPRSRARSGRRSPVRRSAAGRRPRSPQRSVRGRLALQELARGSPLLHASSG